MYTPLRLIPQHIHSIDTSTFLWYGSCMSAKIIPFPIPLSAEDRRRIQSLQEYERRVELSSEVREIDPGEFDRIQREHDEACIRQSLLQIMCQNP